MKTRKKGNREIEILGHWISYYYDKDQEMPEHEEEHVKMLIIEEYNSGELNDDGNYGWWSIKTNHETELLHVVENLIIAMQQNLPKKDMVTRIKEAQALIKKVRED